MIEYLLQFLKRYVQVEKLPVTFISWDDLEGSSKSNLLLSYWCQRIWGLDVSSELSEARCIIIIFLTNIAMNWQMVP